MTLKDLIALIREAVALEAEQGKDLQEAKEAAEAQVVELQAKVAELTGMLASADEMVQSKVAEITEATEALKDVVEDIKEINPTVVADVLVSETQNNSSVDTPESLVTTPEVNEPVVTPIKSSEAAIEALTNSLE